MSRNTELDFKQWRLYCSRGERGVVINTGHCWAHGDVMRQQAGGVFINDDRRLAFDNLMGAYELHTSVRDHLDQVFLKDWRAVALETERGDGVGALIVRDHEAHIGILPAFRGKWRMKNTIDALCALFNITHTWVSYTTPRVRDFLQRNGWTYGGAYERGWYFVRK